MKIIFNGGPVLNNRNYVVLAIGLVFMAVGGYMLYRGTQAWINQSLIPVTFTKSGRTGLGLVAIETRISKETYMTGFQYSLFALSFAAGGLLLVFNYLGAEKLVSVLVGFLCIFLGSSWLSVSNQVNDKFFNVMFAAFTFTGLVIVMRTVLRKKD